MARPSEPGDAEGEPLWRRQLHAIIETQIARHPFLFQMRAVARQLRYERENWSILIPLLGLLFAAVYWRERRRVFALARKLAD